jgi:hypothetical protein
VYVISNGTLTMEGGTIEGNTAGQTGVSRGSGGGVYIAGGTFSMPALSTALISGNTAVYKDGYGGKGGGVFVDSGSFSKAGGTIRGKYVEGSTTDLEPVAPNTAGSGDGNGHAVYVNTGTKKRDSTAGTGVNLSSTDPLNWDL